ncbi:MAG: hypothetical protein ACMZ7B_02170 [Balneola sp.]
MEEIEEIEKPLVYRLTDKLVPIILFCEFILFISFSLYLFSFTESLFSQIEALFLSTGGYFGTKWIHYGHARKNPSMRANVLRVFIGFFWGGGIFLGVILPFIGLFNTGNVLEPTIFIFSLSGLAIALGASHSWKYSFQIKADEKLDD